ncbi:hypothetical protein BKA64DRAFT_773346 [Cadophora sp. MPI-SDFR-AT-0126]|nr:hypothetical protein BKA64DRAFT_773346 [Leotiomycetes sp. MPI-SDFR-AT-0126]
MSLYITAQQTPAVSAEESFDSFLADESSSEESPVETVATNTATSRNSTTPESDCSDSVYTPSPATKKRPEKTSTTRGLPHGYETTATPPVETPAGRNLDNDGQTAEEVKASFQHSYNQWKKATGNWHYRAGFDIGAFIDQAADQILTADVKFPSKMEMAKKKTAAEEVERGLREEQGVINRTVDEVADGHGEDNEEDNGEAEGAGQAADKHGDEQENAGPGHDNQPDDDPYDIPNTDDSDSSSSSEDGWDWVPKKKKSAPAPMSRKRSREASETPAEKEIRWQEYKKRKLAIALSNESNTQEIKEADSCYHPFSASPGLYIGMRPTDLDSDNDLPIDNSSPEDSDKGPSRPRAAATPQSHKRSFLEEVGEPSQPAKKARKTHATKSNNSYQGPQRQLSVAQKWFLEQSKIKPGPVNVSKLRRGAKGRTLAQKQRGDWGTPKNTITKAQMNTIRKHSKYTTKVYLDKDVVTNMAMTHREAIHFEKLVGSKSSKYILERGDVSEEDPIIDGHLIKFELTQFQRIRKGKQARRERLTAGEDQDSESSLSDDDSQYGDDKATCGWDLQERMEYYLAGQEAKKAGVEEDYDGSDEDEEDEEPPLRKNKGKGRAVSRDYCEEDEEENRKARGRNKGKGRVVASAHDEEDYDEPKQRRKSKGKGLAMVQAAGEYEAQEDNADKEETWERAPEAAIEYVAEHAQTIQVEAESEESEEE